MARLDVNGPVRDVILNSTFITSKLADWQDTKAVFTRRPVPENAKYPLITVGPNVTRGDQDGIDHKQPIVVTDVNVYGEQNKHYRDVELISEELYQIFHREELALTVAGHTVTRLTASGPVVAPADNVNYVGRNVALTILLRQQ